MTMMVHEESIYNDDAIVALATPVGRSALAVIRLSGSGTLARLQPIFSGKLNRTNSMSYGKLMDFDTQQTLDEVMIAPFFGGAGYTGEEAAEIFCHGNPYLVQSLLSLLLTIGFRMALPGEFSYRAVRSGKMDLTQAEAVHELITAQTALAAQSALTRLSGRLGDEFREIYQELVDRLGAIEAYLDYPEEELEPFVWQTLEPLLQKLTSYLRYEPVGQLLQEGALVVLAGGPNVGKSSLFNWLVGHERAIVSPQAGTTRDYIEMSLDLLGYPVRLMDTAGLRESEHEIEQMGIQHSYQQLALADVIVYVTAPNHAIDEGLLGQYANKIVWLHNKCDENATLPAAVQGIQAMGISVKQEQGLQAMLQAIVQHIDPDGIASRKEVALLGSLRQKEIVQQALTELEYTQQLARQESLDLVAFSLRKASSYFAQLLGTSVQEDAMSAMFRQFCLGK